MGQFASWLAASPLLRAQQPAPAEELVNTFEFAAMAERRLDSAAFALIAGSDRRAFDRITLRPRMMVNTTKLDLTTELFGEKMFAPILVGPVSAQQRFHREGELAAIQGASAANSVIVISSRSSHPLEQIIAQSKTTPWYQVYPDPDLKAVRARIDKAVELGCKAVCITVGADPLRDWKSLDGLRQGIRVPVLLKGIMSAEEAGTAVDRGIAGIVVSNHGRPFEDGFAAPMDVLPSIAEAVGGKVPILVDGGFRRGTDLVKGLALGARAVFVARPVMWGLAAYGAEGVGAVLKLLQTELARDMAMCGKVKAADIDRKLVTIHRR
jgi:4-hydroxymandelate oxidase